MPVTILTVAVASASRVIRIRIATTGSSTGPAVPAVRHAGEATLKRAVLAVLEPCRDSRGIYRFRNDHQFVLARRP